MCFILKDSVMKRLEFFIRIFVALLVTNVAVAQRGRGSGESKTIKLNKSAFLKRVANFETSPTVWKYLGDKPAIIDFYADWCGPCRRLAPVLDEIAAEYDGRIYVYKVDVDNEKEIATAFGITSLPTIVFVPLQGNPSAGTGFLPKETLKGAVNDILLKKTDAKK